MLESQRAQMLLERSRDLSPDKKIQSALSDMCRETSRMRSELEQKQREIEMLRISLHPKTHFGFINSKNKHMQQMFAMAEQYKDSPLPLLIIGERGCGKEAFSRLIHMQSAKKGPFFVYDENQSIDELFSFKDASIYIGDLSLVNPEKQKALQNLLNRYDIKKTRLIASASSLSQLEPALAQRLQSMSLTMLSLRKRREDILPLIDFFIREFSKNEKNINCFSSSALNKLAEYSWPGNISELKLELKRILMDFPEHKQYSLEVLPEKIVGASVRELFSIMRHNKSLPKAIETLERKMVLEALIKHNWNKSKVSRELGISRSGLIQKVQKYNIAPVYLSKFSDTKRRITSRNSGFISVN